MLAPTLLCAFLAQADVAPLVAVFPPVERGRLTKDAAPRAQAAVEAALEALGARTIAGAKLTRALKRKSAPALQRCGSDLKCIAELGATARADEVILTQLAKTERGIELTMLVVTVATGEMRGHATGVLGPGDRGDVLVESLRPLYPEVERPAPEEPAPVPDEPISASPVEPPPLGVSISQLTPPPASVTGEVPPPERGRDSAWLAYTGLGAAGAGAVAVGLGALFGAQSRSEREALDRESGMSQMDAIATNDRANQLAGRANLSYIIGTVLMTLGASAIGAELVTD